MSVKVTDLSPQFLKSAQPLTEQDVEVIETVTEKLKLKKFCHSFLV